jgi:hypothetical protein
MPADEQLEQRIPEPAVFRQGKFRVLETEDKLLRLRKERFITAVDALDAVLPLFHGHKAGYELPGDAAERVLEAALDMYPRPRDQIYWLQRHLELRRYMEASARGRYRAGAMTTAEALQLKYRRLDAEIALLRAQRAAPTANGR